MSFSRPTLRLITWLKVSYVVLAFVVVNFAFFTYWHNRHTHHLYQENLDAIRYLEEEQSLVARAQYSLRTLDTMAQSRATDSFESPLRALEIHLEELDTIHQELLYTYETERGFFFNFPPHTFNTLFSAPHNLDLNIKSFIKNGRAVVLHLQQGKPFRSIDEATLDTLQAGTIIYTIQQAVQTLSDQSDLIFEQQETYYKTVIAGVMLFVFCTLFFALAPLTHSILRTLSGMRHEINHLKDVLEQTPHGVITFNTKGRIQHMNHAAQIIFKAQPEEMLQKPIENLIPDLAPHLILQNGSFKKSYNFPKEVLAERLTGESFSLKLKLHETRTDQGPLITALIDDITRNKEDEQLLKELAEEEAYVNKLLLYCAQNHSLEKTLYAALEELLSISWLNKLATGVIFVQDDSEPSGFRVGAGYHISFDGHVDFNQTNNLYAQALYDGHARFYTPLSQTDEPAITPDVEGLSYFAIPIQGEGSVNGLMMVFVPPNHRSTPRQVSFLKSASDILSLVVQNKQAENKLSLSEQQHAHMIEHLPAGAAYLNGDHIRLNIKAEEIIGYRQDEITTVESWFNTLYGKQQDAAYKRYQEHKLTGVNVPYHTTIITKERIIRTLEMSIYVSQETEIWLFHDISERLLSEEKFRILFEQSSDAHLLFDYTGITDCNQAAVKMLGCKNKKEVLSLLPATLSPEEQPDGSLSHEKSQEMDKIAREKGSHRFEWMHQNVHGEPFLVEVSLTPITINDQEIMLVGWHDVSAQKENEAALLKARDEAEQANRAKDDFLATMSHEIRTPMNGVIGMTNVLLTSDLTDDQKSYVKIIQQSGDVLLTLLDDFLDVSKIEAGKLEIEETPFNLFDVTENIRILWGPKADEKDTTLTLDLDKATPLSLYGDRTRIHQIMFNLVSNAIKFTERGEIKVHITHSTIDDARIMLNVDVEDSGIGIPEDEIDTLFDKFSQIRQTATGKPNSMAGTGLGLAICKHLVGMMGGGISVKSTLGLGSTFSFSIPLRVQENSAKADDMSHIDLNADNLSQSEDGGDKLHVLVVEDNSINQVVIQSMLHNAGHTTVTASNGQEGIAKLKKETFDIVLMDGQMPVMNGIEATQEIRNMEGDIAHVPIIALTADAMGGDRQRYLDAGMDEYVTKPVKPQALFDAIRSCLRQHQTLSPTPEAHESKQANVSSGTASSS